MTAALAVESRRVPLADLIPSDNPRRKQPDTAYIDQMAESVKKLDIIEPLIVRPHNNKLQIVCGATRYKAAQLAGLETVPVVVRDYDDLKVLEVQLVENIARNSMHPLDEGEAFKRLIDKKLHTAETLAAAIGKSIRWVYNRLEFTKLIAPLKEAFLKDEFTVTHAELLARLEPEDQKRINNDAESSAGHWAGGDALWRWDFLGERDEVAHRSVRSVRDVNDWIETNVRLAIRTEAVQNLLPEVDEALVEAARENTRVLQVARAMILPKDPANPKRFEGVLTEHHWRAAGGRSTCEHAERAVVVFGERQGEVLEVCVAKKLCAKHWPEHSPKAVAKRKEQTARESGSRGAAAAAEQKHREAEEAKAKRWERLGPALKTATEAKLKALKKIPQPLLNNALSILGFRPASPASLPQMVVSAAHDRVRYAFTAHWNEKEAVDWARSLGVNVGDVEKSLEPKGVSDPKDLQSVKKQIDRQRRKVGRKK